MKPTMKEYPMAPDEIDGVTVQQHVPANETWAALKQELTPALRADDSEFVAVSTEDVIRRNKRR